MYLSKNSLQSDWKGVIIYPNRQVDSSNTQHYQELLNSQRIQRIYINELETSDTKSLGIAIIGLIVSEETEAVETAKPIIQKVRQEMINQQQQRELLELLETILIYKLPKINRQELEAMFSLSDLKETKIYQEALEEGRQVSKIESIPRMIKLGLSLEIIATSLDLPLEIVQAEANKNQN